MSMHCRIFVFIASSWKEHTPTLQAMLEFPYRTSKMEFISLKTRPAQVIFIRSANSRVLQFEVVKYNFEIVIKGKVKGSRSI